MSSTGTTWTDVADTYSNTNVVLKAFSEILWTITATTDGNGTIDCTSPVINYAPSSCIVTPEDGYQLASFTDNGVDLKSSVTDGIYSIANVTEHHLIAATFTRVFTLTVTLSGNGSGSVHSSPMADVSCSSGSTDGCSGIFDGDVTLTASPDYATSVFTGWSNACETIQKECVISMTSDKTAIATFTLVPRSKLDLGSITGYDTLQTAYSNAASTIFALDGLFTGAWTLDQGKNISLKGGYLADYGPTRNGFTMLGGKLTIKNGSLRVDRLKIRPQ